ncbi:hypothetical protein CERSUDRAFT_75258 [Gelatoporia subvermispora B]|uniref:Integrase core domain-containing protein n=1 Tax=Ceriporiopsis subvermispora (strain B) TaxID=914234 RepID=M2R935_CERS8|nr:hypothetical protein CERSUDRAFT_75258 [Gelatoporia subvermispora B]
MPPNPSGGVDEFSTFYLECERICAEAQFILHSLPNAEIPAVERAIHQLCAIQQILPQLNDVHASDNDINTLIISLDCLEAFRQVFFHLEENGLLDMDQHIHQVCLFLVFHKRVQDSLDRARDAWNLHKLRTERNKTPVAIYELSREKAMQRGYWTGDPGDINIDPNNYGVDPEGPVPLAEDLQFDPEGVGNQPEGAQAERDAGIAVNHEDDLQQARDLMGDYDFNRDDGNWGINVYCEAVILLTSKLASAAE